MSSINGNLLNSIGSIGQRSRAVSSFELDTDVLVLGGGPAGAWAAISAARNGARVVLADKGFCGTSGATAPSGTGVWYVEPDRDKRTAARFGRWELGGKLAQHDWMDRVLDETYEKVEQLEDWGLDFPHDGKGRPIKITLRGPEYMRLMRKQVKAHGVKILDHHAALELLRDEDGAVRGASGARIRVGDTWTVRSKAVVIATGGCAFLGRALGCNVLTGDGYLMAAEAGAALSGMEYSSAYAMCLANGSVTKTRFYDWATFTDARGVEVAGAKSRGGRSVIARALEHGPVYAQLDQADVPTQHAMRFAQPNFFTQFDRAGINPFTQRFPVTLRLEGTVRGTGGIQITGHDCSTSVPGLYAAGDAATRELICGAFTGGGSHNAAWAISSGCWAGAGAAEHASQQTGGAGLLLPAGRGGYAEGGAAGAMDVAGLVQGVQAEVFPYSRNYFRSGAKLTDSLHNLDALWEQARRASALPAAAQVKQREAIAMLATARWMYRSALARKESRGMHKREDYPGQDPAQRHHLASGGLDEVWVAPYAAAELAVPAEAAA